MNLDEQRFLKRNDLEKLYARFHQSSSSVIPEDIVDNISLAENACEDLWSNAIKGALDHNPERVRKIRSVIRQSDFSVDAKKWWEIIFALILDASEDELSRLCKSTKTMSNILEPECLSAVAAEIGLRRVRDLEQVRLAREESEQKQMEELECSRQAAERSLNRAQKNLKNHGKRRR